MGGALMGTERVAALGRGVPITGGDGRSEGRTLERRTLQWRREAAQREVAGGLEARPCVHLDREREGDVATGVVKKVISDRGFGFITGEDGKDYFFHRDGLADSLDFDRLAGGERVDFDLQASQRGPRAVNVRPAAS